MHKAMDRPAPGPDGGEALVTVRDFLRFAVSRFREAGLAHGHGASSALDEAAFLILEGLHLPVEDINPWLEARLLPAERARLADLISRRVETRKPAAYLLGKTYVGGVPFRIDERAIVPRSYVGELLVSGRVVGGEDALIPHPGAARRILDLCTGSGCLAILVAMRFPEAAVDAVDISAEALELAAENVADHGLADRIALHRGDLFEPLGASRYDLIVSNPPYVSAAEMELLPSEFRHEPKLALAGGEDGLDLVRTILTALPKRLNPGGALLCEIGTGRKALEAAFPKLPFFWLDTEESEGEVFWLQPPWRR